MTTSIEAQSGDDALVSELRRARAAGRRVPDFFIVGHAKCGTTALYEMLRPHPQIYMPQLKETQFLARGQRRPVRAPKQGPRRRPDTLEAYLSLFAAAGPEQLAGEASTMYLRTPAAAGRIAELRPDARIIAIFREPASFLRSLHLQLLQVGRESEADFATAMACDPASPGREGLAYSEYVRYVEQLRPYHQHFGRERVLALIYDDFRRDNELAVRQVLRFLEVDDSLAIERSEANPTVRVRSRRAQGLLQSVSIGRGPVSRAVKGAVKTVTPERLRQGALQTANRKLLDSEPQLPDEEFMAELRRRFKGEVLAASEYLDRDLVSEWGYGNVD
jgi:hypothetical protein